MSYLLFTWAAITVMVFIIVFQYFIGFRISFGYDGYYKRPIVWILYFDINKREWYRYKKLI